MTSPSIFPRPLDPTHSRVFHGLGPEALSVVWRHSSRVRLIHGQIIVESGQPAEQIYFLMSGLVSLVGAGEMGPGPQLAMIGCDGGVGLLEFLTGTDITFATAVVQIDSLALRVSFQQLRHIQEQVPAVEDACRLAFRRLTVQLMEVSASNLLDRLVERCSRWLVMAHERLDGDVIPITHDALATMLGVRRSAVTVVTSTLQASNLVQTGRGRIKVLDIAGLRRIAETHPLDTHGELRHGRSAV